MSKNLDYYLHLRYPVLITPLSDEEGGGFAIEIPLLPGCWSDGETELEALANIEEAKKLWLEGAIKDHMPIAEPEHAIV